VFGTCGGCTLLNIPYAEQLEMKQHEVLTLFEGVVAPRAIKPILGMQDPFHYRNKVVSPYAPARHGKGAKGGAVQGAAAQGGVGQGAAAQGGAAQGGMPNQVGAQFGTSSKAKHKGGKKDAPRLTQADILTGMYTPGSHKLVPTDACAIENEIAKRVTLAIRAIMARWNMTPYNEDTGEGFVRHAVVRVGHESGEVLVTVVTNGEAFPSSKAFCRELVKRVPEITTIVQNINTRATNVILGNRERTLYGPGFILDTLCGLSFRISSQSFYQVNATQTEVLYNEAIRLAQLSGHETVIDAYCGTGTIGLVAAKRGAARVIGVDSVASSIHDAGENARHNGVENAEFVAADATEFMGDFEAPEGEPLVLLMDPPRAGSTPAFIRAAAHMRPERIVYISCNPHTQERDLREFEKHGYCATTLQPVDMFPHTRHVETIAVLSKEQ
jgi:23S rRNA (uracil1939-C5)-methyltransferase